MVGDINSLKTATKSVLRDIAKHAGTLSTGLQNAAPPQESGPSNSVLYLGEISKILEQVGRDVDGPHEE